MTDDDTGIPGSDTTQIKAWKKILSTAADNLGPAMDLYRPYVDGLENLPPDGRFLLVGNHTRSIVVEVVLIPYFVRKTAGARVRPLADRQIGKMRGPQADLITAFGAVVGSPETAAALMRENETILVFPGGGRDVAKFKGEEYTMRWETRSGFARIAVEHRYPIVTAALVGGDDVFTAITTRDSRWGRFSGWVGERISGRPDMAMPLLRGIGPTLIPRPQRMYLRFGPPIDTAPPARISGDTWTDTVKARVHTQLQTDLSDLQRIRRQDPYHQLNPLAWRSASMP